MHMKMRAPRRWLERRSSSLRCLFTRVCASLGVSQPGSPNAEYICPVSFVWWNWHPQSHLKNATHVDRHSFCPKGLPTPSWHPSCTGRVLVSPHDNPYQQAYCLSYPWLPSYTCISVPPCDNPYTHTHSVCSTPMTPLIHTRTVCPTLWHTSWTGIVSVPPYDSPHTHEDCFRTLNRRG